MLLIFFSKMQKQILDQNNFSPLNFAFLTNVQKNWLSPKSFGLAQNSCKSKVNIICNKQTIIFQKEKSQKTSLAIISLERNSSSVGYSTVNGITTPNYKAKVAMGKPPTGKKKFEEKVSSSTISTSSSSASNKDQQLDKMTLCLTTR